MDYWKWYIFVFVLNFEIRNDKKSMQTWAVLYKQKSMKTNQRNVRGKGGVNSQDASE